jgi:cell division protein FtsL
MLVGKHLVGVINDQLALSNKIDEALLSVLFTTVKSVCFATTSEKGLIAQSKSDTGNSEKQQMLQWFSSVSVEKSF